MVGVLLLLAAAAAQPSPEALKLGRQLAEVGALSTLLPLIEKSEVQEMINDHPELSKADEARFQATADRVYFAGRDRLLAVLGRAYAERLSVADLKTIIAFQSSAAARRYREATPEVVAATMKTVGKMDFKGAHGRLLQGNWKALPQIAASDT